MNWVSFGWGVLASVLFFGILTASQHGYALDVCNEAHAPKKCKLVWVAE